MSKENENLVRYVVINSRYYWGKSETLEDALQNANVNGIYALNSKKKNTATAMVYRVEIDPIEGILTEKKREVLDQRGISTDDLEIGDVIEPWVEDFGGVGAFGKIERVIKLKIK
jgi:hypothetical protein